MTETVINPLLAVVAERDSQIADLKDRLSALSANHHNIVAKVKNVIKKNLTDDGLDRDDVIEIATILGITLNRTMQVTGTFEATVEVPIDYNGDLYYVLDFTIEANENDVEVVESDFVIDHVEED